MIKLTKNELRDQQHRLSQLERYLPTLQLKKAMLQGEVGRAEMEIEELTILMTGEEETVSRFDELLSSPNLTDLEHALQIVEVKKSKENIAGVDIPVFEEVVFEKAHYSLFGTPLYWDKAIEALRALITAKQKIVVAEEKKAALEKELREVSIRVNLFEKILIPRAEGNIKKIKVFLGDQQLAAVAQAKAAKNKILEKKARAIA